VPLYEYQCKCGRQEVLVPLGQSASVLCSTCGIEWSKVPSRMSIRVPGPKPMNTEQNYALYREICDETMDIGRRMAEEQGEPMGEHGCAVLPGAMGRAMLKAHETFEKGLADDS
jgi:hypothetical protein